MAEITRKIVISLIITSFGWFQSAQAQGIDLSPRLKGKKWRAQATLKVNGELKFNQAGKKVVREKLAVQGTLLYREHVEISPKNGRLFSKTNETTSPKLQSARRYERAESKITVGKSTSTHTLPKAVRDVRVIATHKSLSLASPGQPMTWANIELLDLQANSLVIHELLPEKKVKIGEKWDPTPNVLAQLLRIDAVSKTEVVVKLAKATGRQAELLISGKLAGAVDGVSTEIDLSGRAIVDRSQKLITQLVLDIKENRSIGHVSPGLEVTAELTLRLDKDNSKMLAIGPVTETGNLIRFHSNGHYRLLHSRKWRTVMDTNSNSVFRFIDNGNLIAQCNIQQLMDLEPKYQYSLEKFQNEVRRTLGEGFGQLVESAESKNQNGLRVKRLLISGTSSELPVFWIYYLISADNGRRVALIFTLESELMEKFAAEDETFLSSFELLARPSSQAAKTDSTSKKR